MRKSVYAILFTLWAGTAFGQYRLYWGDVHGHSALSDGKGSPDDYFTYARDVAKLDFVILTDHDFGNGRPEWRMPKENWALIQDKADRFNADGRFVAIGGYEWTSQEKYWSRFTNGPSERLFAGPPRHYNHKNVYFPSRVHYLFSAKDAAYNNPDSLAEAVLKHGGLIHNNHPSAEEEGLEQFDYTPAHGAVIVNTEIYPDTIFYRGKSYSSHCEEMVRAFLKRGGRTGFVAGSDTHEGRAVARTAVLATELTRAAIFDALRHRRNYAINHARIGLDFRINGHFMGEEIEVRGKPRMVVDVQGTAPIDEIIIVRDGEIIHTLHPQKPRASFTYVDETFAGLSYYYVRVIQSDTDTHGNKSHAWSSPIWVRQKSAVGIGKPVSTNAAAQSLNGYIASIPPESPERREARHKKIAERRSGPVVIVHRGAWSIAPENTLEAYAAAMDHGADGCEIDIRRTADGVLAMLHDDGLDRMTDALGPLNQHTYAELSAMKFRPVYAAKPETRIPTFVAVLELARQRAMLLHLDVKEPGLEDDIAKLLEAADVWDHVVAINENNALALRKNPKVHLLAYKAFGWQEGRMDMNPEQVKTGLAKPGNMIMVDDPRVAARELKRTKLVVPWPENLRAPLPSNLAPAARSRGHTNSLSPTAYLQSLANRVDSRSLDQLGKLIASDLAERTDLEGDAAHQQRRAHRILERAWAAQKIGQLGDRSARAVKLLEDLIAHRSLHRDWAYSGLDGAMAARALGVLGATDSVPFLVRTFLAVDPELKKLVKPPANYPYAWADYRMKREIICVLGELHCEPSKKFLREYVAMDEATAGKSGPPLFEEATRSFLSQLVTDEELQDLLRSTNSGVRGTAILVCLENRTSSRAASLGKIMPWTLELP